MYVYCMAASASQLSVSSRVPSVDCLNPFDERTSVSSAKTFISVQFISFLSLERTFRNVVSEICK